MDNNTIKTSVTLLEFSHQNLKSGKLDSNNI